MTTKNNHYLIDEVTAKIIKEVDDANLFVTILKVILAVQHVTEVTLADLMNKGDRNRKNIDAKHIAMLLLHRESIVTALSRKSITSLFGLASQTALQRAEKKYRERMTFRIVFEQVEFRYQNTILEEYHKEIPF